MAARTKSVPVIVGLGVVAMTTVLLYKKKKAPVMLTDPAVKLRLADKESISHNTSRFHFKLPSNEHIHGLSTQHMSLMARIKRELVLHADTPVSSDNNKGYVDNVIKTVPVTLTGPTVKVPVTLIEKESLSHNTRRFRFKLPSDEHILGLPIGRHITMIASIDGELIERAYTPVSSDDDKGYVDFIIKVYFKHVHPKFQDGGKMTQFLEAMEVGDSVDIKGPIGGNTYLGNGNFSLKAGRDGEIRTVVAKKVSMIAGGSGITPMLQLIHQVLKNPEDKTHLSLLYANQTEDDILLRDELEQIQAAYPSRFKLWYTLDRAEEGWRYSTGFINEDMIRDHLEPAAEDNLVVMCGPPPMIKFACVPSLDKLGYSKAMRVGFGVRLA